MPIARAIPNAPSHELLRKSKGNAAPWLFLEGTFNEPSSLCELGGWNHCLGELVPPSGVVCSLQSGQPLPFPGSGRTGILWRMDGTQVPWAAFWAALRSTTSARCHELPWATVIGLH